MEGTEWRGLGGMNAVEAAGWRERDERNEGNGLRQRGGRDGVKGTGWKERKEER